MLDLDCRVHEAGGVTLVGAVVESSAPTARRVRIETALEGPVWPPRRNGVPEPGWDDDGFEGIVPAGGRLSLGFASPAGPTEPPVFVVDHERADPDDESAVAPPDDESTVGASVDREPTVGASVDRWSNGDDEQLPDGPDPLPTLRERTPTGLVHALGSPTPPADAVPEPHPRLPPDPTLEDGDQRPDETAPGRPRSSAALPRDVADWLTSVESRVQQAEALADARRVTTAAGAVDRAGGLDGARQLADALERDERALRAVARRARRLAERAGEADVPLSTLRRLA